MSLTVFELSQEAYDLATLVDSIEPVIDEETGEVLKDESEILDELAATLQEDIENKLDNIGFLIRESEVVEQARKDEAKRLTGLAKSESKKQERLKYLANFLLKGEKRETKSFKFSYRKSTAVNIIDEGAVPPEYIKVKEVFSFDKKAIADKLKEFEPVDGCELKVSNNLQIR